MRPEERKWIMEIVIWISGLSFGVSLVVPPGTDSSVERKAKVGGVEAGRVSRRHPRM